MRHFLGLKFALAPSVSGLPRRLQSAGTQLAPVPNPSATNRVSALLAATRTTEALSSIATAAEAKLNPTAPTDNEPIAFQRQGAPSRRFLDLELRLW